MISREKLLERAQNGVRENKTLDFKTELDLAQRGDWCEIIKDIVAFANSGGGVIVVGLNDDATPSGYDVATLLAADSADVTNRIARYTGHQYSDFEIIALEREEHPVAAILILGADTPMVFDKPGTYETEPGRQKTAFSKGTVYFRHGAKSEPGSMNDLRQWRDRELEKVRESWLGGIRQVVEAPSGHTVQIVGGADEARGVINARIGNDPNAATFRPDNAEEHWPYRQTQLINRVLRELPDGTIFNGHDILCIRSQHNIQPESRPDLVFKPHANASPQYSEAFADWIVAQQTDNPGFCSEMRRQYRDSH